MECVVTLFKGDVLCNHHKRGHAKAKPKRVDDREGQVLLEIPEGEGQVVGEHTVAWMLALLQHLCLRNVFIMCFDFDVFLHFDRTFLGRFVRYRTRNGITC